VSTAHPQTGRNYSRERIVSGPNTGGYETFTIAINTVAAAQTDLEVGAIALPYACRVMEIAVSVTTSVGGATRATFQVTDGTNDLISADPLVVTAGSQVITPQSAQSLVALQRDRAKGDRLQLDMTTVAAEVVTALTCQISVWQRGHIVAAIDDD
jgi:hypothetical protein